MMRFFGGKVLLEWELAQPISEGRFAHLPLWQRIIASIGIIFGVMMIGSFLLIFLSYLRKDGLHNISMGLLYRMFFISLGIGLLHSIFILMIVLVPRLFKDRVAIREYCIESRYGGQAQIFRFRKFDFYAFGESEELVDGERIRILSLVNERKQSGFAIELPAEISEEMIDDVLRGRMKRNDRYGGRFQDKRA